MKAVLVKAVKNLFTLAGHAAGAAVPAITAWIGLTAAPAPVLARPVAPHTTDGSVGPAFLAAPAALLTALPVVDLDTADEPAGLAPALLVALNYTTLPTQWSWSRPPLVAAGTDPTPATAAMVASSHRGLPGWLEARTRGQAALIGLPSRPIERAAARRPRPGNRPARRPASPKPTAARKVVWMSSRPAVVSRSAA